MKAQSRLHMSGFKVRSDLRNNQSQILTRKLQMAERNCAHVGCHRPVGLCIDPYM